MTNLLSADESERVAEAQSKRYAPRTLATYKSGWDGFCNWLDRKGVPITMPVHPDLVALYALGLSEKYAFNTVGNAFKSIAHQHRERGFESPTMNPVVREIRASLRKHIKEPLQVRPLYAANVKTIVSTARLPRPSNNPTQSEDGYELIHIAIRRGNLDIAIVATMFDAMLRISEAATLTWADISYNRDGSGLLYIRHSKGDQEGAGAFQWLTPQTMERIEAIRPVSPDRNSLVFGVTKWTIQRRIRLMTRAGGLGAGYSGHSPRIGMIHELVAAGISHTLIVQAARWRNPAMLASYTRKFEVRQGAVAQLYGDPGVTPKQFGNYRPPSGTRYMDKTA